jgi:multicomponent K+:H+ antiporter subunit E
MRSWASYSLLAAALVALWLLLNQTLAAAHWVLALAIAAAAAWGYALLRPPAIRVRSGGTAVVLMALVLADIVRSNVGVARIVFGARTSSHNSGFVDVPLELRNPAGLAALACIITSTPGTAWARYDSARGVLTMHILDLIDEREWIEIVKQRYERRLLEIFP